MMEIRFGNYLPAEFHGDVSPDLPPVRVAVIGTGQWAREHARAFDVNPYAELIGIRGRDAQRVEKRAAEFRITWGFAQSCVRLGTGLSGCYSELRVF